MSAYDSVHAITFAFQSGTIEILDESLDQHSDGFGRTYVFLVNNRMDTWHGYVTPETLAVLHHVAGEVLL